VINIDGDGSIRMNFGELETVTTYGLPVKVLVLNNNGDGMVRQWQRIYFAERFCGTDKSLHKKDFIKAAEADGFEFAVRVSEKAKLPEVLKAFVEYPGPAFLEIVVDQDATVYPMVGPGAGYKEMITGDFIPARQAIEAGVGATDKPDLF
jgi:acetolactate synthase-1/2/3 large subunit